MNKTLRLSTGTEGCTCRSTLWATNFAYTIFGYFWSSSSIPAKKKMEVVIASGQNNSYLSFSHSSALPPLHNVNTQLTAANLSAVQMYRVSIRCSLIRTCMCKQVRSTVSCVADNQPGPLERWLQVATRQRHWHLLCSEMHESPGENATLNDPPDQ